MAHTHPVLMALNPNSLRMQIASLFYSKRRMTNPLWFHNLKNIFAKFKFSHLVMSDSLRPHGLQHARLPCPSPTPRACLMSMSIESVMPSNHLILCHPLLLLPSIFPSIRVFSNESAFHIRWPKYWSFSFSISPSNEYSGLVSLGLTGWISLQSKGLSRVFSNTTVWKHQFFGAQPPLWVLKLKWPNS